jgi:hypothetical protein
MTFSVLFLFGLLRVLSATLAKDYDSIPFVVALLADFAVG